MSSYRVVPADAAQNMLDAGYWPCTQNRGAKSVWREMVDAAPVNGMVPIGLIELTELRRKAEQLDAIKPSEPEPKPEPKCDEVRAQAAELYAAMKSIFSQLESYDGDASWWLASYVLRGTSTDFDTKFEGGYYDHLAQSIAAAQVKS